MRMFHTLEHIEHPFETMRELYRIAKPGCIIEVRIPWWKYDMFTCPYHRNWFRPRWFYWLSKVIQEPVGEKDNIRDMKWCPAMYHQHGDMDWRVIKDHTTRGKHKFWKKYEYRVWLKAHKVPRKNR
jgi:ubiquinone/menaquinone biosynthesis C-methylase UbiE